MKQEFLKDIAGTIRLTVYQDNRPVIPSSATITLKKPDGSTLQASASATINSTTGELTYSLTTTHTATLDLNYKASWAYVVSGTTYYQDQLFDIVRSILSIPIIDDDIYNELDALRKTNFQATGTATSAAAGTLLDTARRKEEDSFWKGGIIEILSGIGEKQKRDITGFTQSTSTVSVYPDWATTPDTTSTYRIVKSLSNKIQQAFKKIETSIYNHGNRAALIIESSQIEIPLIYLTVHMICLDLMSETDDKWHTMAKEYMDKYEKSFAAMKLDYDEDESGAISEDEKQQSKNAFWFGRS